MASSLIARTARSACLLVATALPAAPACAGDLMFMFMPTLNATKMSGAGPGREFKDDSLIADLFLSGDRDKFRFLGELQLTPNEADMERLQFGWRAAPEFTIWAGRFHNPIGYWNTEHHHGHYLEVSVSRPRITAFEDDGGPLPIHLTGLLMSGSRIVGESGVAYDVAVASGPRLDDGLEPVDLVGHPRRNALALTARLAIRPDVTSDDQVGAFVAKTRIPVEEGVDAAVTDQWLFGALANWEIDRFRVSGEIFRIVHRSSGGTADPFPSYWAGYAQVEYKIEPSVWTAYARYEGISSNLTESYREFFPALSRERELAGLRWDFLPNQAFKLELRREVGTDGATARGGVLQWSAMFP